MNPGVVKNVRKDPLIHGFLPKLRKAFLLRPVRQRILRDGFFPRSVILLLMKLKK